MAKYKGHVLDREQNKVGIFIGYFTLLMALKVSKEGLI